MAKALTGSWRTNPPPPEISESEFDRVAPLLLGSGAAALGWRRLAHSNLHPSTYNDFQQAYRLLALQDSIHESEIRKIFSLLRASGIEPVLVKGWAIARSYPETVLRPFGDMDIFVLPEQHALAQSVLSRPEAKGLWFDLHKKFEEFPGGNAEELFERSRLVKLGDYDVRVMSEEDHFALLSIHMLRHGAWRPLWLCDIGAALETRAASFDWQICLGRNNRRAKWITCAIGLAREFLGARVNNDEIESRSRELPGWLVQTMLKQWESPFATNQPPMSYPEPMKKYLRNPLGVWEGIRVRWPDPIKATIDLGWAFNGLPRFPVQISHCIARTFKFFSGLTEKSNII
ncbi:MAG TPA: nucleotidyltransferase family protein [Pyrinomonadaceae bacterium]|nr:nucleotidyltransferase family protein [Pyrinomonadaceae bacterium]